jgi:N-acylneuraminate cytidylyltransferase
MAPVAGKRLAVIPARGGSIRIRHKNILDFHGKPLLMWSYEAAIISGRFDRVVISTEDEEVAEVARRHGAPVPFLRTDFFDAGAAVADASINAMELAEEYYGESYHTVVQLMPTCPLRTPEDINAAVTFFDNHPSEHQVSCVALTRLVPWSALGIDVEGRARFFPQRDDWRLVENRPTLHQVTGAIWIATRAGLLREREFYGPDLRMHVIPWASGIDIDTYDDLAQAWGAYLERCHPSPQGSNP